MDRIIFLGTQVDDYTANVIQAQLLYLDSSDPGKDISWSLIHILASFRQIDTIQAELGTLQAIFVSIV